MDGPADDDDDDHAGDDELGIEVLGVQSLDFVDAVRRRPGMYVGDTGAAGLHELVAHLLDLGIDEYRRGYGKTIRVHVRGAHVSVAHDGRGIPRDRLARELTTGLNGGSFIAQNPAIVNALARELEVETVDAGTRYTQRYARGRALAAPQAVGPSADAGTRITFAADPAIFEGAAWDRARIEVRARELAALHAGVRIELDDRELHYADGLLGYLRDLATDDLALDPLHARAVHLDATIEVAIGWRGGRAGVVHGFVNDRASDLGSHVDGVFAAVHAVLGRRSPPLLRLRARELAARLRASGLLVVLHVEVADPRVRDARTWELAMPEVAQAVREVVDRELGLHFERVPALLDALLLALDDAG